MSDRLICHRTLYLACSLCEGATTWQGRRPFNTSIHSADHSWSSFKHHSLDGDYRNFSIIVDVSGVVSDRTILYVEKLIVRHFNLHIVCVGLRYVVAQVLVRDSLCRQLSRMATKHVLILQGAELGLWPILCRQSLLIDYVYFHAVNIAQHHRVLLNSMAVLVQVILFGYHILRRIIPRGVLFSTNLLALPMS